MDEFRNITILGAGSWGTTLAVVLSKQKQLKVNLWSAFKEQAESILSTRENKDFLPGISISRNIFVTSDLSEALTAEACITAVPVEFLRDILKKIDRTEIGLKNKFFLSVVKGIEIKNLKRPSEIIRDELSVNKVAVLSGPTIAKEVVKGLPTAVVISSENKLIAKRFQKTFQGTNLRVYRGYDLIGIELAGALKNVIAIACGISEGLGFGTNTKAALVTRGLVEIIRLGAKMGAKPETFWGIGGLGDLSTTAFSPDSRNRSVGQKIGQGLKLKDVLKNMKMVAEGVKTVKSVHALSKKYKVDMPIANEVYRVLYLNKSPLKAVRDLMSRPFKAE